MKTASQGGKITATYRSRLLFMRYRKGTSRSQALLFPPSIEDSVSIVPAKSDRLHKNAPDNIQGILSGALFLVTNNWRIEFLE